MKRLLSISLLILISFHVLAQKVTIQVYNTKGTGISDWQILDDQNRAVFSGIDNNNNDSVSFSLEADRHYTFKVTVYEIYIPGGELYTLVLNGEPLIRVIADIGKGEHIFPFFTGVRTYNQKITGGTAALISDFPWQIYFISGNFRCGGSIINGNWIVTAAHCTQDDAGAPISSSSMFVKVGANDPSDPAQGKLYSVGKVIVHEAFDNQTLLNDIALLRLTDTIDFTNATPINLITADEVAEGATVPGVLSWVTGWGLTQVSPEVIPTALQKVQLPIITNAQASSVWSSIPATDIMAGFLNGNKDACNGDSGGPLAVPVLSEYRLAGIVSWGSTSCDTYGAYSRVSDFETWIQSHTGLRPLGDSIICQGTTSGQYSIIPVPGASAYQWVLLPSSAGVITGNGRTASVNWNTNFTGKASIILRATINTKVSDWFRVHAEVAPPTTFLSQSADTNVCAGQPVTLNMNVKGYDLIYKWAKNGQVIQTGSSSKLSIASTTINDSGDYSCVISGACGTVTSGTVKLTVYAVTKITSLSPNVEAPFGGQVSLQVKADGHDLVYQWQKNGTVIENSNTSDLVLSDVNASDIGIYRTTVSGTCGVQLSDSIYVYVKRTNFTADPEVFLWPSITSQEFNVALSNDKFYNIEIFSTSGKKISQLMNCRYQTNINISTFAKGVYVVEVFNSDFRKSIKIIKD
jgi:hypothetical protein